MIGDKRRLEEDFSSGARRKKRHLVAGSKAEEIRSNGKVEVRSLPTDIDETAETTENSEGPKGASPVADEDSDLGSDSSSKTSADSDSDSGTSSDSSSGEESDDDDIGESEKDLLHKEMQSLQEHYNRLEDALKRENVQTIRDADLGKSIHHLEEVHELFETAKDHNMVSFLPKDALIFKSISQQSSDTARNLKLGTSRKGLNPSIFNFKLTEYLSYEQNQPTNPDMDDITEDIANTQFANYNWAKLGALSYLASRRSYTSNFLLGALSLEKKKVRTHTQRTVDEVNETVTANRVTLNDIQKGDTDSSVKMMKQHFHVFAEKSKMKKVNLFEYFIDPGSYARTIENMLYTSFMLNYGKIILVHGEDGIPYIQVADKDTIQKDPELYQKIKDNDESHSQFIVRLEMDVWEALIKKYNITKPYVDPQLLSHED
ncbi:hypothetical protein LJB42_001280 [Komagataella kurtzmanii]|nr:hypothetical protein LJB42_001280 [Komagataella kurtzmanii]